MKKKLMELNKDNQRRKKGKLAVIGKMNIYTRFLNEIIEIFNAALGLSVGTKILSNI